MPRHKKLDIYLGLPGYVLKAAFLSWFGSGILLIPFNLYLSMKKSALADVKINCKINGIVTSSGNRKVFFELNGKTEVAQGYQPIMEEIKDGGYNGYDFVVCGHEGPLHTFILKDWNIQKHR